MLRLLNITLKLVKIIRWCLFEYYQFQSHLDILKNSFEPESNQRPKDCWCNVYYSPPLYQLSYRRKDGCDDTNNVYKHKNHILILIFSMRSNYIMLKHSYNKEIENIHHFQWMFIKSCVADKVFHEICIHSDFLWKLQNHSIFAEKKLAIF